MLFQTSLRRERSWRSSCPSFNHAFENFQTAFHAYHSFLDEEDQGHEYCTYEAKEQSILEFRSMVVGWIAQAERHIQDLLASPSEISRSVQKSTRSSTKSSKSGSSSSRRADSRAKLAELYAERALLKKRQELERAREDLRIETEIAKAEARERVYAEEDERNSGLSSQQERTLPCSPERASSYENRPQTQSPQHPPESVVRSEDQPTLSSETTLPTVINRAPPSNPQVPTPSLRRRSPDPVPPVPFTPH